MNRGTSGLVGAAPGVRPGRTHRCAPTFAVVVCLALLALPAFGQTPQPSPQPPAKLDLNLDHLAKNAVESVTVTLDRQLLKFAAKFIPEGDDEAGEIKKLINGLDLVYVRVFEFEKEGMYPLAEIEKLRKQLRGPGWWPMVKVESARKGGDNVDVFLRREADKVLGLAIIVTEPTELTVVNIVGDIDLEKLSKLEGHMGIPRIGAAKKAVKSRAQKDKDKDKDKDEEDEE